MPGPEPCRVASSPVIACAALLTAHEPRRDRRAGTGALLTHIPATHPVSGPDAHRRQAWAGPHRLLIPLRDGAVSVAPVPGRQHPRSRRLTRRLAKLCSRRIRLRPAPRRLHRSCDRAARECRSPVRMRHRRDPSQPVVGMYLDEGVSRATGSKADL